MQEQPHWRRLLLRSEEGAKAYEIAQQTMPKTEGCRLCNDPETITDYKYWRLVPNRFPYDRYFSKSEMLVSKRHVDERGLTSEEMSELYNLKTELAEEYDLIFENMPKQKSIPHHIHYHLVEIMRPE